MCKVKIKCDGVMQLSEVIANLESIARDMKAGSVMLAVGEDCLTLQPPVLVNMAMRASQKKDKEKFVLELSWRKYAGLQEGAAGQDAPSVTVWHPAKAEQD